MTDKTRKEIYTYEAPWTVYGLAWTVRKDKPFRIACGSFLEEYSNKVEIIQLDENEQKLVKKGTFDHPYPTTKIMWIPDRNGTHEDLIATTGDYLRLWKVGKDDNTSPGSSGISLKCLLNNNQKTEFCAPLTSFDWNETDPSLVGTSSIDTTCTIWNVETLQARTQLIAHDKEVYDIAFARGVDVFASVGADGSVRMFDLRNLEHSTIMYESPAPDFTPMLRLAWNKQDPNYLSTIQLDGKKVLILDIRVPSVPVAELKDHDACVNAMAWAPHSSCHICTASDDRRALIWDLSQMPKPIEDPILAYDAGAEVNQLTWSVSQPDWVSIAFSNKVRILRV